MELINQWAGKLSQPPMPSSNNIISVDKQLLGVLDSYNVTCPMDHWLAIVLIESAEQTYFLQN